MSPPLRYIASILIISSTHYNMIGWYNTMGKRVRGSAEVTACFLAAVVALAPGLAAQGAKEATGRGRSVSTVARPASHLQPARGMLGDLVGSWRFAIWFAGNFSGPPRASGGPPAKPPFHGLRLGCSAPP